MKTGAVEYRWSEGVPTCGAHRFEIHACGNDETQNSNLVI
jgi:hypothetical protein